MTRKYFQPKSLTWWASVTPLISGRCSSLLKPFTGLPNWSRVLMQRRAAFLPQRLSTRA